MENDTFIYVSPRTGREYEARFSNYGGWGRYDIYLDGSKVQFALQASGVAAQVEHYENPGPDVSSRYDWVTNMVAKVKVFHYKVKGEVPISYLAKPVWRCLPRLRVFAHKGTICVTCGKIGTRLVLGKGKGRQYKGGKGLHWDVYTDDLYPLTVDHIVPKSLGGSDHINNLQPMCSGCNSNKGNGLKQGKKAPVPDKREGFCKFQEGDKLVGREVWQNRSKREYPRFLGIISQVVLNPHTGNQAVMLDGNPTSMYDIKAILYKPQWADSIKLKETFWKWLQRVILT